MIRRRVSFLLVSTARAVLCSAGIFVVATCFGADTNSFAAQTERAFHEAEKRAKARPVQTSALIEFARAAYDAAEFTRTDEQREEFATRGIDVMRSVIGREPTNTAAHYWLGMDLGQLARTKTLGALKLVREMESEFHRARALDPHYDYAGPDRSLGYLYRDAPGWPASIGNKNKAREHLEHAVKLHPEFPDNQLGLVESFEKWSEPSNLEKQLKIAARVMAEAESKFVGPAWEISWADWKKRLAELQRKNGSVGPSLPTKGGK